MKIDLEGKIIFHQNIESIEAHKRLNSIMVNMASGAKHEIKMLDNQDLNKEFQKLSNEIAGKKNAGTRKPSTKAKK